MSDEIPSLDVNSGLWTNPFEKIPDWTDKMYLAYVRASGLNLESLEGLFLSGGRHASLLMKEVARKQKLRLRREGAPEKPAKPVVIKNCPPVDAPENADTIYIDETGIGSYAGPAYVTAVFLCPGYNVKNVTDSKKYTNKVHVREQVAKELKTSDKVIYATVVASVDAIDKYGIWGAWDRAIPMAVKKLAPKLVERGYNPTKVMIDGSRTIEVPGYSVSTVEKGDSKYSGIAAASVIAKTDRDAHMCALADKVDPMWREIFVKGHGYAYKHEKHKALIMAGNATEYHRRSYNPYKAYLAQQRLAAIEM